MPLLPCLLKIKIMKLNTLHSLALILVFASCQSGNKDKQFKNEEQEQANRKDIELLPYPEVRIDSVVDDYFGTKVADPYRWLENDTSAETAAWVKAQNKVTFNYLEQIPFRQPLKERLTKLWNYEKVGTPFKKGPYYFFYKNDGIQNQSVLYWQEGLDGKEEVLLDPNKLSEEGTTSINGMGFSKNAGYMAYGISKAGSDWVEIRVMDLNKDEVLEDQIKWVKFSGISWQGDGFYYSAYEPPKEGEDFSGKNEFHKIYYHQLAQDQSDDDWFMKTKTTRNGMPEHE